MDHFQLKNGVLYAEDIPVPQIAAEVGTPVYIYSRATLERHARVFRQGLKDVGKIHLAFAVKANPNLAVLRVLANQGYGADVVSGGELERALAAGMKPEDIVFSGVGKTRAELTLGLDKGIGQFNLESEEEGQLLAEIAAARGAQAPATLRVNPDVDAGTHAKISTGKKENKFGVGIDVAPNIYARLSKLDGLNLRGVAVHIGSQLQNLDPLEKCYARMGELVEQLRGAGHEISHVDLGGGLGVPYKPEDNPPSPADYGAMVERVTKGWNVTLMFEPGRVIAGNSGIMATQVIRIKPGVNSDFVIVDAAMNDLMRPAIYDAWHHFEAVEPTGETMIASIVGPICESSDIFTKERKVDRVATDDLGIFRTAGAYGATMANTYNSRPLVPEVLVDGDKYAVVAERIEPATIMAAEQVPDWLK
ncbi:diaminopimelate decarboxylase [Parasphingorhabdus halotolerans]|uniref:Diaminopimelate decarboxylase n=1 Tax=Parasphingorhabdus halotolerans TaxID=2725558 RepID=A0A6H2DP47_9SPHN|nr:diaminopimelate decarboxylase [Parasphingorhabdus halotolerans]QJB69436.1 diaminopimelate decarboxylase [Parasphingorhabdus halotolerans]